MEVKRVGSSPSTVTIKFEQDFAPPVYKVDPRLAEVRAMRVLGHASVIAGLQPAVLSQTCAWDFREESLLVRKY
jgi:hypothetical protein